MKLAERFDVISCKIDDVIRYTVFVIIVTMIITITLQIICRVFFESLTWSEELSRYLLVWSTFLGATMAYRRGMHIAITFVVDKVSGNKKKFIQILSIVLSILFFGVAIYYGVSYMARQTTQVSAALRVPMTYVYAVIPISCSIMTVHGLSKILWIMSKKEAGEAV